VAFSWKDCGESMEPAASLSRTQVGQSTKLPVEEYFPNCKEGGNWLSK